MRYFLFVLMFIASTALADPVLYGTVTVNPPVTDSHIVTYDGTTGRYVEDGGMSIADITALSDTNYLTYTLYVDLSNDDWNAETNSLGYLPSYNTTIIEARMYITGLYATNLLVNILERTDPNHNTGGTAVFSSWQSVTPSGISVTSFANSSFAANGSLHLQTHGTLAETGTVEAVSIRLTIIK